jgi:hypothetical protein
MLYNIAGMPAFHIQATRSTMAKADSITLVPAFSVAPFVRVL